MKKILLPTEFAAHAPQVFRYALEVALHFKAKLVVMHAFGKPNFNTASTTLEQLSGTLVDQMMDLVNQNCPEEYKSEVEVNYLTKVGFAAESILQVALDEEADLIVMGKTGKSNALETIFGSTSTDVLAKADIPVLIVPAEAKFEGVDNLVYSTDFEFRDFGAINFLRKWSKRFEADLHCLHVIEANENNLSVIKNMSILKETYAGKGRIYFDMVRGKFEEKIEQFSKSKKADIICMVSHKRSLVGRILDRSVVQDIAYNSHLPLLVIKDNAFEMDESVQRWVEIFNSIA